MLIAEMPELSKMTSGEAAAMTGLAPVPYDSETIRGKRMIAGERRTLRHILYQAAFAAAYHNTVLSSVAQRLKERGKPTSSLSSLSQEACNNRKHILKNGASWSHQRPT
jgi:transposase